MTDGSRVAWVYQSTARRRELRAPINTIKVGFEMDNYPKVNISVASELYQARINSLNYPVSNIIQIAYNNSIMFFLDI